MKVLDFTSFYFLWNSSKCTVDVKFLLVYILVTLESYFNCYSDLGDLVLYSMSVRIICTTWEAGARESLVVM